MDVSQVTEKLWRAGIVVAGAVGAGACGSSAAPNSHAPPSTVVASITVTPDAPRLLSLNETVQLSATAADTSGNPLPGTSFTWSSSNDAVASVTSAGLVTAIQNGTVKISAQADGAVGTAQVTVRQTAAIVTIDPPLDTITVGTTTRFSASVADAGGSPIPYAQPTWQSTDTAIATITPTGTAQGKAQGSASIVARSGAAADTALLVARALLHFASVSADGPTCGVTVHGEGYCWGNGDEGQLGDGSTDGSTVPSPVSGGHTFAMISAGIRLACGVDTGGGAFCWGLHDGGLLGDGATDGPDACPYGTVQLPCATSPVAVTGGHTFAMVDAGVRYACGVLTDGTAMCWGLNDDGELGTGSTTGPETCDVTSVTGGAPTQHACSRQPVLVTGGLQFASVSVGDTHACGLTTGGDVYCWGTGYLGDGNYSANPTPVQVLGGLSFKSVTAGFNHTCGLTTGGAAYCWGVNQEGALGVSSPSNATQPNPVSGGLIFTKLSAKCGVTNGGDTYCWGANANGQLGIGSNSGPETCQNACSYSPVKVTGGIAFVAVSSGHNAETHACGLTLGGTIYCWGSNSTGELGDGSRTDRSAPVVVRSW